MSRRKSRSSHHAMNGKNFIILPIVFCLLTYLFIIILIYPSVSAYSAIAGMFFSEGEKNFSQDYQNIFVPIEETSKNSTESSESTEKKHETVNLSEINFPSNGTQFGQIIIDDCQIDARLFFGDGNIELNNGVGIYTGSAIPGYGRTILVAGHNNTFFNGLKYAQKGQKVKIRTSYGNYTYEINDIQVKRNDDRSAYDFTRQDENLIMYTCYPFDELGLTPMRCFVYAKFISGPVIDKDH